VGTAAARATGEVGTDPRLALASWVFTPLAGVLLGDWLGVLLRHGVRIPPRYWARTAFTTAMAALNSAVRVHEALRYHGAVRDAHVRAPVFILGHHRSGTTHLWNLLGRDPRFASPTVLQAVFPHTMLSFERAVHALARRATPDTRPQDNVRFGPDESIEEERAICAMCFCSMQMARHFPRHAERYKRYLTMRDVPEADRRRWAWSLDLFARKLLVRKGLDKTLLFKAADHTGKVTLIRELYPDARFIHLHRHPYEVYRSTIAMERATMPLYAYQRIDDSALEEFVLWRYREMYDAYLAQRPGMGAGSLVELGFDDLRADPIRQVERIYSELDLDGFGQVKPLMEQYMDSVSGYKMNRHPELLRSARARVAERWKPAFEAWGYRP